MITIEYLARFSTWNAFAKSRQKPDVPVVVELPQFLWYDGPPPLEGGRRAGLGLFQKAGLDEAAIQVECSDLGATLRGEVNGM